ncbi:MAG: peptide chain release factor N(5)-glutamine methyltransferase [Gammaproteobacteria bacterium]|nr:peptide chain release factor N(5)-glutamine methyltransferase [Gammaproteobacteria bacterium]MBT5334739.1 peptide chain release factor N(5)-glutamine methyltransferase [Gammaproteobacteria bacterium]MBT5683152.1 peptide chain release factor N(5)-glutamine methyltransferase [Gammaproteobacteria bacterium]MBT6025746.1 peptide chain release factor N(5)-glutamine methyltransferase [Gammaproteobacteria bacterium]MBT6558103.1 peptide chain release factor N(5)-glutamine methyltransferase [Gammaprot
MPTGQTLTSDQWIKLQGDLPRLDCELTLCHILEVNRASILARPERPLSANQLVEINRWADALRNNVPFAYLVGEQEFWGLNLAVSPHVLVPRPETELLVESALALLQNGASLLDLGTGSGAIALAIASERVDAKITATDISTDALLVAKQNAETLGIKVTFQESRWLESLTGRWQIIVSNPPYIDPADPHLENLHAEPQHALIADEKGFADLRQIITEAPNYLANGGWLLLEHGFDQAQQVRLLLEQSGFQAVTSHRDLANIERVSLGQYLYE